jgi:hypothetical protein|tara:strand:- start:20 stop:517 length:498 start_codon:yes stop_codon:yes gene_type:complete
MKKIILLVSIFTILSCQNQTNSNGVDEETLTSELIESSISFQLAYINNKYPEASKYMSDKIVTTIFNSSGQPLVKQTKEEITSTGSGWAFDSFEMTNHKVFLSPDMKSAAITFEAQGVISFEDGNENMPYSTRASQFWITTKDGWKILHSHWSPKTSSKGVPGEK